MGIAPAEIGVAEIEIAKCATHRDLPDGRRLREAHALQRSDAGLDRGHVAGNVIGIAPCFRLRDLVPAGDSGIHDAVAQRLQAERFPAAGVLLPYRLAGKEFAAAEL